MSETQAPAILPQDSLDGLLVGLSVSESDDLPRLGLIETHFRLALGEIARCVLVGGGRISYAGHVAASGYTPYLLKELQRYHRRDRPLVLSLPWPVHRSLSRGELDAQRTEMGLFGGLECLDEAGNAMADPFIGRGDAAAPTSDRVAIAASLSAMRKSLAQRCDARVLIGGRRTGYQGVMPGVAEEAIAVAEAGKPLFLAAGFGGATLDVAKALGVDDGAWFPSAFSAGGDPGLAKALTRLETLRTSGALVQNGLNEDENKKLAATHRPSEIAALVSLGLGRLFALNLPPSS